MAGLIFTPAARLEVIEAQDWYEREAEGLGARFRGELEHLLQSITANPQRFPSVNADVRKARMRRFPYSLYFREKKDAIYILACFHFRRNPMVWQNRV